jgi:NADPH-dependent ferric siderophore reductase
MTPQDDPRTTTTDDDGRTMTSTSSGAAPTFARPERPHPFALRHLAVARTEHVTPLFARVTLVGAEGHDDALDSFASDGPDDHVKVFFPDPATGVVTVPVPRGAGPEHPPPGRVIARDYTPRAFRPAVDGRPAELDLDVLLHGDDGPASFWATRAQPGDQLVVGGPRSSQRAPADAEAVLLLGDESALPAVARWLETLPDHVTVSALLEVANSRAGRYLPDTLRMRADILWLFREHGDGQLGAALRGLGPLGAGTYVFAAGEAGALVPLRQHLRKKLGLPARQVKLSGYWRRGVSGSPGEPA